VQPSQPHNRTGGRKSADCWEVALRFAKECREKFDESVGTVEDIEKNSTAALELLAKSVRSIPHASRLTGAEDPCSMEELKNVAHRVVHSKFLNMMDKKNLSPPSY